MIIIMKTAKDKVMIVNNIADFILYYTKRLY